MNLQKLAEFRSVVEAMDYPELEPFTGSLKLIYDNQVDSFTKEAGEFTDRLHGVLKKFFPQNAPQEQQGVEQPPEAPPEQAPQAGESEIPFGGETESGIVLPDQGYKQYRGLGEQVDLEDSENKSQEIAVAVKGFQGFVNKMNQAPHGYDPAFVEGVNGVWKQLKNLIRKYLHEPRRDMRKQVQQMPLQRQTYPPEQNEFVGKVAKNIRYL